ncbi:hypothetical protein CHU95_16780 [Niveispirillum lacus]|uniref:Uncharacterized protein n=1 Tax=Niveispirillum lacus TaxID=1981099 RepID=A0A255YVJ8_9PROT|nr:hypothetical protein CHU95_16780 [Niveispirillum lacus]
MTRSAIFLALAPVFGLLAVTLDIFASMTSWYAQAVHQLCQSFFAGFLTGGCPTGGKAVTLLGQNPLKEKKAARLGRPEVG